MSNGLQNGNMMQDAACGWPVFLGVDRAMTGDIKLGWDLGGLVMLSFMLSTKIQWLIMMFPHKTYETCHVHP